MDLGYGNSQDNNDDVKLDENGNPISLDNKDNLDSDGKKVDENGNPIDDIDKNNDNNGDNHDNHDDDHHDDDKNDIELHPGEIIEVGENKYTVAENGDLIDKDGKVFKESKDVQEYLKSLDEDTNNNDDNKDKNALNLNNIKEALGYQIVDENDKEIEYEDNVEGVKNYVKDVIEQQIDEIKEATINTLFEKYPFALQAINYYVANGNSLEGWNVKEDRSGITIDDNNEKQQEDIIRTAWKEQKRTGDVESYIAYLKSSGILLSTAKTELEGLQKSDKAREEETARLAQEAYNKEQQQIAEFWKEVSDTIKSRKIGKYEIPEQIKVVRNGKAMMATPTDFLNYISVVDRNGETAYAKDCKATDPKKDFEDNILKAYLKFTGGDYSSLVEMAIKEKEVKTLRFKAKDNKNTTRRFNPKSNDNNKVIDLGF